MIHMTLKKISSLIILSVFAVFISCGPAAEDRNSMVARSKVVQDSIANAIRTAIAEADGPAPIVVANPSAAATTSQNAAPVGTTQAK